MAAQTHAYGAGTRPAARITALGTVTQVLLLAVAAAQAVYAACRIAGSDTSAVAAVALGLELATVPAFVGWFYQARVNAGRWREQWRTQGWAVVGWFIPVIALWFPFEIADGVWRTSDPSATPRRGRTMIGAHPLLKAWWACWLLSWATGFSMRHVTIVGIDGQPVRSVDYGFLPGATTVSCVVTVAAAVLAGVVVRRITQMQNVRLAEG